MLKLGVIDDDAQILIHAMTFKSNICLVAAVTSGSEENGDVLAYEAWQYQSLQDQSDERIPVSCEGIINGESLINIMFDIIA